MPLNIRKTLVLGGLTVFGFLAGGKLGSFLGTVLGAYVCHMLEVEPVVGIPHNQLPSSNEYSRTTSRDNVRTSKDEPYESLDCTICLEKFKPSILLLPCSHMCICDDCYVTASQTITNCPICRESIMVFKKVKNL